MYLLEILQGGKIVCHGSGKALKRTVSREKGDKRISDRHIVSLFSDPAFPLGACVLPVDSNSLFRTLRCATYHGSRQTDSCWKTNLLKIPVCPCGIQVGIPDPIKMLLF